MRFSVAVTWLWMLLLGMGGGLCLAEVDPQPALVRPPFAKGTLLEIDPSQKSITLAIGDGRVAFVVTDKTRIYQGDEKLTLGKIKTGDILAVRFVTDAQGRHFVSHIKVYPAPAPASVTVPANHQP